jgi:ribonuclease HI
VEDKLIWEDNTNGIFSVKSGYKTMLNVAGRAFETSQREEWKYLWNIRAPPKAKHLLWRICKGCLPTRMRLQEKRVPCPLLCPFCNQENEDDWHVLFDCEASIHARNSAGLDHVILPRLQQHVNARDLIFAVCSDEDRDTAGLFAMLLSVIWSNRNSKVWNESSESGRMLGFKARHLWEDWDAVQKIQQRNVNSDQQQLVVRWEKPMPGWYKCNVDAAFHQELNKTSTGWCLRDHLGRFVVAATTWLDGNCSIVEGESIALLEAMKFMELKGYSHVVFETDSKNVVDAIHHFRSGSSDFSLLVSNICHILSCNQNFMVKFAKRLANMVAHTLARAAISWSRRCTFETLPLCITHLVNNEMI